MKTIQLTFESDNDADEFLKRWQDNCKSWSSYQAEIAGAEAFCAKEAKAVDSEKLTKNVSEIEALCNAPHWESDRRWKIQRLAMDCLTILKGQ